MQLGLIGLGAHGLRPLPALAGRLAQSGEGVCFMMGDHWSYIGIGWQLGIESCALSVLDALNIADQKPGVKTCLNMDARAYEIMAREYPIICERLKQYLAEDKVEIIGGSYAQPMATLYSGESCIRQIVMGHDVIREALDVKVESFLEEEEFSHPQMPQILTAAGIKYTSLAQLDTWAYAGCPELPLNVFYWKGMDGSTILCQAKNRLFTYDGSPHDLPYFVTPEGKATIEKLEPFGKPCVQYWSELGWEDPETPRYLTYPKFFEEYADKLSIEFVTLRGYLKQYGSQAHRTVYFDMDAWDKLLPWGIGGDQIRAAARRTEAVLHAAERFDAVANTLGSQSQFPSLETAWRNLLTAQSHDVNLCEYSRWQGDRMAPLHLIEDHHDQTWGSIGYQHLDGALKEGQSVFDAVLADVAKRVEKSRAANGPSIVVFNPCSWERTALARSGKVHLKDRPGEYVSIVDGAGRVVPFQVESSEKDLTRKLAMVDVSFLAVEVPSVGYDTYYLKFTPEPVTSPSTALTVNESNYEMENSFLSVRLDPTHGGIVSLVEKQSGKEFLAGEKLSAPAFYGQPNLKYPFLSKDPDTVYDSSSVKAKVSWLKKGPLQATLKAVHEWKQLTFETRITLDVHSPRVEVLSRILTQVPPTPDPRSAPPGDFPRAERNIKNGYWLAFALRFAVETVYRDFPLGTEPTKRERLHGLTFADFVNQDQGLMIVHSGCQYFRKESDGTWSNLVMREWESEFTHEYGFPQYAEFTHWLLPHNSYFNSAHRARVAMEFDSPLVAAISQSGGGELPPSKSFVHVEPDNVLLSAFRKGPADDYEMRLLETAGQAATAKLEFGFPSSKVVETDLHGHPTNQGMHDGKISLVLRPWQFRTLHVI